MNNLASMFVYILVVVGLAIAMAALEGCAGSDLQDYATERNYLNDIQCNTDVKDVTIDEVLERGCFTGESSETELGEPNVSEKGTEKKEDSLF